MITNVLNNFDIDFMMPISKIDENFDRAHKRNGLLTEKFWWKVKNIHSENFEESLLKESDFVRSNIIDQVSSGSDNDSED